MKNRDAKVAARSSGGSSGGEIFYSFVVAGQEDYITRATAILDLGCGQGLFGEFINRRFDRLLDGVDLIQYENFKSEYYETFILSNLEELGRCSFAKSYDLIFAIGVIEYLANPRLFIKSAINLLTPNGKLLLAAPNPISLSSLGSLAVRGQFSAFLEKYSPASITPVLPLDAVRMIEEAELSLISLDYSNMGRLPLAKFWFYQRIFPFLKGRFFSDHYRVIAKRCT